MMAYIRLWGLCALHIECGFGLTAQPGFSRSRYAGETIIDMPYCRVIYTPGNIAGKAAAMVRDRSKEEAKAHGHERQRERISCSPAGAAEN